VDTVGNKVPPKHCTTCGYHDPRYPAKGHAECFGCGPYFKRWTPRVEAETVDLREEYRKELRAHFQKNITEELLKGMKPVKADRLLTEAAALIADRGKERDKDGGERSMARCVKAFNAMTGNSLSEEQGWLFMVYLKHARMQGGAFKKDDYDDAIAYAALQAECAINGAN